MHIKDPWPVCKVKCFAKGDIMIVSLLHKGKTIAI